MDLTAAASGGGEGGREGGREGGEGGRRGGRGEGETRTMTPFFYLQLFFSVPH